MNNSEIMVVLEVCLLSKDNVAKDEMVNVYGFDSKLTQIGIKLYQTLKEK